RADLVDHLHFLLPGEVLGQVSLFRDRLISRRAREKYEGAHQLGMVDRDVHRDLRAVQEQSHQDGAMEMAFTDQSNDGVFRTMGPRFIAIARAWWRHGRSGGAFEAR